MAAISRKNNFFLGLLVISALIGFGLVGYAATDNIAEIHSNSNKYDIFTCENCHSQLSTVSGAGGERDAHRRHFVSVFLNFAPNAIVGQGAVGSYGCAKCHYETNLPRNYENDLSVTKATASNDAAKQVKPAVCLECHGQFRESKHLNIDGQNITMDAECTNCHNEDGPGLDPKVAHGAVPLESTVNVDPLFGAGVWWVDQRYANAKDFCTRCHGGLAWFESEETNRNYSCQTDLCHRTSAESFLTTEDTTKNGLPLKATEEFLYETTFTGSHRLHFDSVKGPGPCSTCHGSCDGCHGTGASLGIQPGHRNDVVNLVDTTHGPVDEYTNNAVLADTPACDRCHSPEGGYDGVESSGGSVGAKDNWDGVYATTDTLKAGKEAWCVGCHDDYPASVIGQTAQNVGGDGSTYGFFKSGHGLDSSSSYDKDTVGDGSGNPGGGVGCDTCHDLAAQHLNGADNTGTTAQRVRSSINDMATADVFSVCTACHQNAGGSESATRQVSTHGNDAGGGYTPALEEPFTIECATCHELHGNNPQGGSRNLKMVRESINSTSVVFTSTSGDDSFDEIDSTVTGERDDICVTCHVTPDNNPGYDTTLHAGGIHASVGDQRGTNCTACHPHDYLEDGTVIPSDGFMISGGCDGCHTYPAGGTQGTYKGSKTHDLHTTTYGFGCVACHSDYPVGHNESGVGSKTDWDDGVGNEFDPANVDVSFDWRNPSGTSTIVTSFPDRNRQCSDLYCHGQNGEVNGKAFSALGGLNASGVTTPTWDDENNTLPANKYDLTKISGECGTCHDTTQDNTGGSGSLWPNWDPSGTNDWSTDDATVYDVTSGSSLGQDSTSHAGHLDELRGPKTVCKDCHATPVTVPSGEATQTKHVNTALDFTDDTSLAVTAACDTCHSPNGPYDGVDDAQIGAKNKWATGVYDGSGEIDDADEKWCVGCHDNSASVVRDTTAAAVGGDGSTYGFFATGHGRKQIVKCWDCHELGTEHIDGDARTYAWTSDMQGNDDFRTGYRLKTVDSTNPLVVPMNGDSIRTSTENFRLCWKCHNQNSVFSSTASPSSNFMRRGPYAGYSNIKQGATGAAGNSHTNMLNPAESQATGDIWNSDWDDDTGPGASSGFESGTQCVTCHAMHGSTYPGMIRDGKLSGKDASATGYDGFEFSYVTLDSTNPRTLFPPFGPQVWGTSNGATKANSLGGVFRMIGNTTDQRACSTDSGCHDTASNIANTPKYQINALQLLAAFGELGEENKTNVIDYYRDPIPVALSAAFTSDDTITVVFCEAVDAVAGDFTDITGSSGATRTVSSVSGSGTDKIEVGLNASLADSTGTLDIGAGITSSANGTPLTAVNDQGIWDAR